MTSQGWAQVTVGEPHVNHGLWVRLGHLCRLTDGTKGSDEMLTLEVWKLGLCGQVLRPAGNLTLL